MLAVAGLTVPGFLSPYALADSTVNFSEKGLLALEEMSSTKTVVQYHG